MLKNACKIVIPSHKRHERVLSQNLVPNPIICVEKKQLDIYREFNPNCEIVAHPNDIIGLIPKRNWMLKHFGDIFMIDDDVTMFQKFYPKQGNSLLIKNKLDIYNRIQCLYELAIALETPVFGFTKNPRPEHYPEYRPLSLSHTITGCAYGVLQKYNLYWNEDLKLKEDYWISCLCKYKFRKILVDQRFRFTQIDTFINPGGLSDIRNINEELKSILILKKYFGNTVKTKISRKNTKLKKKNDVTIQFTF